MLAEMMRKFTARSYICNACGYKFEDEDRDIVKVVINVIDTRPLYHAKKETCPKCGSSDLYSKRQFSVKEYFLP